MAVEIEKRLETADVAREPIVVRVAPERAADLERLLREVPAGCIQVEMDTSPRQEMSDQTSLPMYDAVYVRELERRLARAEDEVRDLRARLTQTGLSSEAVLSGKAALDWKRDALELKIVIRNVSRRHGLLQELADLRVDEMTEEVPVYLSLRPLVDQQKMPWAITSDAYGIWGPEKAFHPATDLEALQGAGSSSEGDNTFETQDPAQNDTLCESAAFERVTDDYEGTTMPLYTIEGSLDMGQVAEAAFQASLPECVIELSRPVRRGGQTVHQTALYHYRGPGHDPVIERLTGARLQSWVRERQSA